MESSVPTTRIEALADALIAIIMTLLVIEIKVPSHEAVLSNGLASELSHLWPHYLGFVLSAITVGTYWVGHHNQYPFITRSNRTLLWINILFFTTLSFVPFTTGVLSEYYTESLAVATYAGNLALTGFFLALHWQYAYHAGLVNIKEVSESLARSIRNRTLRGPILYLIGVPLAYLAPSLALAIILVSLLSYLLPTPHFKHTA